MKHLARKVFACAAALAIAVTIAPSVGAAYADEALQNGTYTVSGLSSSLGMYHFDSDSARVVVKGSSAWLITTTEPDNTTTRYDGMAYGPQSKVLDSADQTNRTLVTGTPTANVIPNYASDGITLNTRTYVLPVEKSVLETGSDIPYVIKYVSGYSESHDGDWYVAKGGDYHFGSYTLGKESDSTELPGAAVDFSDGTYEFASSVYSTGMVTTLDDDVPAQAVIRGDDAWIIISCYNPDKYDAAWKGKRSEAPEPANDLTAEDGLIRGIFVEAEEGFSGGANTWTDDGGLMGDAGTTYKALKFVIPVSKDEFKELVEQGSDGRFYVTVRRSPWSPSNAGKWMGSNDNYFTFGELAKVSDSTNVPGVPEESDLDRAKRLIAALKSNPFDITEADEPAIKAAKQAFDVLPQEQQEAMNTKLCPSDDTRTYGRWLENSLWMLEALKPVDNSTTLADGTYTGKVEASSSMGLSNSPRNFSFSVVKVTVKDGKATAVIKHGSDGTGKLRVGGNEYDYSADPDDGHSLFTIPIDLNSTMHFAVLGRDAGDKTDAITYTLTTSIDEQNTKPDSEKKDDGKSDKDGKSDGKSGGNSGNNSGGKSSGKANGGQAGGKASSGTSGTSAAITPAARTASSYANRLTSAARSSATKSTVPKASSLLSSKRSSANSKIPSVNDSLGTAGSVTPFAAEPAFADSEDAVASETSPSSALLCALLLLLAAVGGAIAFGVRFEKSEQEL